MRKGVFWIWVTGILVLIILLIWNREYLSPVKLSELIRENKVSSSVLYFFLMIILGFFVIPNSALVMAGALIFVDDPFSFILVSVVTIFITGILIYYFAQFVNLEEWLNRKYPEQFRFIQIKLEQYGFWIITVWSLLPLVPTSLICYASGVTRYSVTKFLSALLVGETIRITLYTLTASGVVQVVF